MYFLTKQKAEDKTASTSKRRNGLQRQYNNKTTALKSILQNATKLPKLGEKNTIKTRGQVK